MISDVTSLARKRSLKMVQSGRRIVNLAVVLAAANAMSCFAAPETCRLCNEPALDAAADLGNEGTGGTVQAGTGASPGASGGSLGASGGASGSGGNVGSGGAGAMAGSMGGSAAGASGSSSGGTSASGGAGASSSGGAGPTGGRVGSNGSGGASTASGGAGGGPPSSGGTIGSSGGQPGGSGGSAGASASGGMTGSGGAGGGGPATDPDLVLWYKLDESSGTTAADSALFGGTGRNGTLTNVGSGTASFSTMVKVGSHAVALTGTSSTAGGYVSVPNLSTVAPGAITIACWVNVTTDRTWQRVFDFGKTPASGAQPTTYMFLTTHQGVSSPGSVRFGITTKGNTGEEQINMTTPAALSTNAWHHLAVTLGAGAPYTGTLYIDHAVAGTNTKMTLHWSDLGATDANNLGRSLFSGDPYFAGLLDDCRVYRRALSATEIAALP
jgi:hypothetical protein